MATPGRICCLALALVLSSCASWHSPEKLVRSPDDLTRSAQRTNYGPAGEGDARLRDLEGTDHHLDPVGPGNGYLELPPPPDNMDQP